MNLKSAIKNNSDTSWGAVEGTTLRTSADFLTVSPKILIVAIFTSRKDVERRGRLFVTLF